MDEKKVIRCWKHPEMKDDEVFMSNIHRSTPISECMGWKQYRIGETAYYNRPERKQIPHDQGMYPVFVKAKELIDDGFTIEYFDEVQ
jgi:hypothetical protein